MHKRKQQTNIYPKKGHIQQPIQQPIFLQGQRQPSSFRCKAYTEKDTYIMKVVKISHKLSHMHCIYTTKRHSSTTQATKIYTVSSLSALYLEQIQTDSQISQSTTSTHTNQLALICLCAIFLIDPSLVSID